MPDGDDEAAVAVDAILLGLELRISDGRLSSTFSAYHALHSIFLNSAYVLSILCKAVLFRDNITNISVKSSIIVTKASRLDQSS